LKTPVIKIGYVGSKSDWIQRSILTWRKGAGRNIGVGYRRKPQKAKIPHRGELAPLVRQILSM
jgi:hypothetical protein